MKRVLKVIACVVTFMFIFGINNLVYGVGRFVDIPVPPESSGHTDITSEEAEQQEKEYEENQENTNITAEEYVEKSSNNYLKKLEVEGYKFEPEFNSQVDNYIIYVKDKSKVNKANVMAEADDAKAKIEGVGEVEIKNNLININVIAENGNLKVYTIRIENQDDKGKQEEDVEEVSAAPVKENEKSASNSKVMIFVAIVGIVIIVGIFVKAKCSKK